MKAIFTPKIFKLSFSTINLTPALYKNTVRFNVMKVIPIYIEAGISGFESPAAEYKELGLSLDQLLIRHPNATFIGQASGQSTNLSDCPC